ncbi:peptidyl-prolyl cis-trans isomerase B (cyclophilin B) [Lysinibacillus composti]|uniref:Peptidyl-prolyl cis-trans isomerase n=1 Tax=Lysinibacillus composti TaxID=720633 RepID=A0A3N9UK15_9BACI|nr:peptidylprolyl isomerase [Lysinibacillus composti]MBM7610574.1 peptidyl-prolyl cis-trans isomerase B (cyclophilin B) [Lysinibacillus composti]RQW71546.1 peptidylprolyl isomerase [Lysinibacillus composti]
MVSYNKVFSCVFSLMAVVFVLTGCGTSSENGQSDGNTAKESNEIVDYSSEVKENPIVTITMSNEEKIVIELEPATAPNTVANFISLVEDGFYDGLIFHRVIPDFMIQGGDPLGNGTGDPGYSIEGEFSSNGFENNLKHERGVISMARSSDPNSAGSQFFIMVEAAPHLDGEYAAFGKVIEGIETVDAIVAVERNGADKPLEEQKMQKVEVDTKGFDYPDPVVQK